MIEFAWPYAFGLIIIPFIIYKYMPKEDAKGIALRVPAFEDFDAFSLAQKRSSKVKKSALIIAWSLLVIATARPQWVEEPRAIPESGRDLMLAVDLSGSMQTQDFKINNKITDRLSALKIIVSDFIERRRGDRIGLILFGSKAYLQAPLTFDIPTVKQLLMETAVGLAGHETALGDAIGLSIKQLKHTPQESRVLILITDGVNNAGELNPLKAADIAAHEKLKIYTIAIGSTAQQYQTIFGTRVPLPAAEIDEKTLMAIAEKTGGHYFRASNTDELIKIYGKIDNLEKRQQETTYYRPTMEIYYWPLGLALLLISLLFCHEWMLRKQ